jgi:hypothetical protein
METAPVDDTEATGDELAGDLAEEFVADGSEAPGDKVCVQRARRAAFGPIAAVDLVLAHCRVFPMMPQHRFNGCLFFFWFHKRKEDEAFACGTFGLDTACSIHHLNQTPMGSHYQWCSDNPNVGL